jgi:acyl carrier protein
VRQLIPDELTSRILEAIAKFKKIPIDRVTLDSTFEELGIDSLDGLEFFFEIEGEFGVNIPDAQLRSLRTVRQAVDGITQLIASKAAD